MNEETEIEVQPMDAQLLILMQYLKDHDESGIQQREHANNGSTWVPEIIEGTDSDL